MSFDNIIVREVTKMNRRVSDLREDDDIANVYHGKCGHWHYICYLCSPFYRSNGFPNQLYAMNGVSLHMTQHSEVEEIVAIPHK